MSRDVALDGAPAFSPIRMLEIEISRPVADITPERDRDGQVYTRAWALVRLHDEPIGVVRLALPGGTLPGEAVARAIGDELHTEIADHLRADAMAPLSTLGVGGIPGPETPPCVAARETALVGAPFVSVVIATRDRAESLAACLQSFDDVEYPNYEIVVVDNAPSTEATAELIASTYGDDPRVVYVREPKPGLSWAHNCGIGRARGEFIAFTDDDVVVDRHWIGELVRGFAVGGDVGCVTGLVMPREIETPSQYWFETNTGFNKGFRRQVFDLGRNRPADPLFPYRSAMFGTGANMAFRAAALRAIGGMDPALSAAGPDIDAFFRIIKAGYQLVYQPSALVHHLHRADYEAFRRQCYNYGVGLTAYLTKTVVADPLDGVRLVSRLPAVIAFARRNRSVEGPTAWVDYPPELTRAEVRGRFYGPVAYARSRWKQRRMLRHARRD